MEMAAVNELADPIPTDKLKCQLLLQGFLQHVAGKGRVSRGSEQVRFVVWGVCVGYRE